MIYLRYFINYIKNKALFPNEFWIIVLVKVIVGSFLASHYLFDGFVPFIEYFAKTANDPYSYFFKTSNIVFPYPSGMLILTSPLFFISNLFGILNSNIFTSFLLLRIPILIADVIIYIVLCKLLPTREKKVLWLYFASPILFYINYIHGQLDAIPTAFLFSSLYFLANKKLKLSHLILGIGVAVKTHLIIVLPFYVIYLVRNKKNLREILSLIIIVLGSFVIINLPFVSSSYISSVFDNPEQKRLFFAILPYTYKNLAVLLAPAALLISFYIFASRRRLNFDSLILTLGLVFTILIALVPPMQGWFYWSLPLFIYFLIKYKDSNLLSFALMNVFFILFFVFTSDSDIFESASILIPYLSTLPTPYAYLISKGFDAFLLQNILFTCLQISVAVNAFWTYKLGIYHNNLYIEKQKPFVLGIGGDSGVGKSTLSEDIKEIVGSSQIVILNGDDSHKWERNDKNWQIFTHLNPKANYVHKDLEQMYALIDGKTIQRVEYDHKTGKFTKEAKIAGNQFIIFQGLHPFLLENMREIYDLKIFVTAEEKLRKKWKIIRDTNNRGYAKSNVSKEISKRKKDSKKFISPQKDQSDWIIEYYEKYGRLCVKYTFRNSIPLDIIVEELGLIKNFRIEHYYSQGDVQQIKIESKISKKLVMKIGFKIYPNIGDLIDNQPEFENDIRGLNQLFFINYINYIFLRNRKSLLKEYNNG